MKVRNELLELGESPTTEVVAPPPPPSRHGKEESQDRGSGPPLLAVVRSRDRLKVVQLMQKHDTKKGSFADLKLELPHRTARNWFHSWPGVASMSPGFDACLMF